MLELEEDKGTCVCWEWFVYHSYHWFAIHSHANHRRDVLSKVLCGQKKRRRGAGFQPDAKKMKRKQNWHYSNVLFEGRPTFCLLELCNSCCIRNNLVVFQRLESLFSLTALFAAQMSPALLPDLMLTALSYAAGIFMAIPALMFSLLCLISYCFKAGQSNIKEHVAENVSMEYSCLNPHFPLYFARSFCWLALNCLWSI